MRSRISSSVAATLVAAALLTATGHAARRGGMTFLDATRAAGLDFEFRTDLKRGRMLATMGGGVGMADYDGDGFLDLFFTGSVAHGERPSEGPCGMLFRNHGDGTFENTTEKAGIRACGWTMGAHWADVDSDGLPDLLVTGAGKTSYFHNLGGRFEEAARERGLNATGFAVGLAAGDVNGDGRVDVYAVNYLDTDYAREKSFPSMQLRLPDDYGGQAPVLYLQKEDGRFEDGTARAGVAAHESKGMAAVLFDFDLDGDLDIYITNDRVTNVFYRNRGDGSFENATEETGAGKREETQARAGMGIAIGDPNGDGHPDVAVTNFAGEPISLYQNVDGVLFEEAAASAGLAAPSTPPVQWGTDFADLDDDGWQDLVAVSGHLAPRFITFLGSLFNKRNSAFYGRGERSFRQHPQLFHNTGGGRFEDVSAGAGDFGELKLSARGLGVGDVDGDGRLDLAIAAISGGARLMLNRTENPGSRAIEILPAAGRDHRTAIGTKVIVRAGGRRQMQEFILRPSYASGAWVPLHFGLGKNGVADKIEVIPPGASEPRFTFENVAGGRLYTLRDGELLPLREFRRTASEKPRGARP
ncbi:MAG: CRTAC1 family protein [Thermoanaerobaculia bacterium]|nr:CRTAC1 family protein [Thermoanaerobaculia bacterium]